MRIREVTESRVDELAPLAALGAGALTWAIVTAAIDAYFLYEAGKEVDEILSKYKYDTSLVSEDDWWNISIVVVATGLGFALPGIGKWTVQKVSGMVPASMKGKIIQTVKEKVIEKVSKTKPSAKPAGQPSGGTAGTPKDPNKVERPFSADPTRVSKGNSAGKPPKNPNLIDRPFQKEELLRLAGMAK